MDKITFEPPSNIKEDLDHLREWISQQPHLIARTDDKWLYVFLRGCKFSLQKTKQKIERYYTLKSILHEFFGDRDPLSPKIQEVLKLGMFLPLPKTKEHQGRYFIHQCKHIDPEKVHFSYVLKVFLMVMEVLFMEDINNENGGQYLLCDLDGLTMQHLVQATPSLSKKAITFLKDAYPGRPQGFFLLNASTIFENTLNTVKPLLGKKLVDRIKVFSSNSNHLTDDIPISILPKEFGGKGRSLAELKREWLEKVNSYRDWFVEDKKYGCDESKRVESLTYTDVFGMEGSFKKLSID